MARSQEDSDPHPPLLVGVCSAPDPPSLSVRSDTLLESIALGFVAKFALQPVRIPYVQGLYGEHQDKPETANSDAHSSQAGSLSERSMSGDSGCGGDCGKLEGACPF